MEFSRRQADIIIDNLRSVVQEDINFISDQGIIIASSDASRVGNIHMGALMVAETLKPLEIEYEGQYEGALPGINLPVFYEGDLVAVIGITGDANKIRGFSGVIVKMTEILVKEYFFNRQKEFKRENNRVILELITKNKFNRDIIRMKMEELGYDNVNYHYFVVCRLLDFDRQNIELANRIYNSIEKRIHMYDLLARHESKYLLLTQTEDQKKLINQLRTIKDHIENKYNLRLSLGVSEKIKDTTRYYTAYQQADMVVEMDEQADGGSLLAFDGTSLEFFLRAIPQSLQQEFARNVLNGLDDKEVRDIRKLIKAYV